MIIYDYQFGIAIAVLFFVIIIVLIVALICKKNADDREQAEEALRTIVAENSEWYKNALDLNRQTRFHEEIFSDGNSVYVCHVNSKAKFERTSPEDGLWEFLMRNGEKVKQALEQVYRNRVIYEAYCKKFAQLHSLMQEENCEELGIPLEEFRRVESDLVRKCKLRMIREYCVDCYVKYESPQGRNHYSKHEVFDESAVRTLLKEMAAQAAYQETEAYRRRNERSRITPSIRYDVMRRDGFRCRLCGRSANSGVELEVDHIIPISKGGASTYDNLQTLCRVCNRGKGAKN